MLKNLSVSFFKSLFPEEGNFLELGINVWLFGGKAVVKMTQMAPLRVNSSRCFFFSKERKSSRFHFLPDFSLIFSN